jgi:hypothetical protein
VATLEATATAPDDPAAAPEEPAADEGSADGIVDWRDYVPSDVADHLATMDHAARDSGCGVPWHLLAAIARVESDFGRNMATSSAGALGYGQFLPSSWQAFGNSGNVYDYRDALPAIATYLCQSGLARDPRAALFAYNHADWYVDLVLELAVRYDRLAPGAPTPDVLDVGPASERGASMHYAAGRDLKQANVARTMDTTATWLAAPWRGRAPGLPISRQSLDTTTLVTLRAAFGLIGDAPTPGTSQIDGLADLADRAWAGGLLPLRGKPQAFRSPGHEVWSLDEVRQNVAHGLPVVALVSADVLPGHPLAEHIGDQPVVILGITPSGLVYSDPSFSSSLGYGLELSDADFLKAWDGATLPRQALAFSQRPKATARTAPTREVELPPVGARIVATPTALPESVPTPVEMEVTVPQDVLSAEPDAVSTARETSAAPAVGDQTSSAPPVRDDAVALLVSAAAMLAGARWLRLRRARPTG